MPKRLPLGKGLWIRRVRECAGGEREAIVAAAQAAGYLHVILQVADGADRANLAPATGADEARALTQRLTEAGVAVWGAHSLYADRPRFKGPPEPDYHRREAERASERLAALLPAGLQGYVLQVQGDYERAPQRERKSLEFMDQLRAAWPEVPLALAAWKSPRAHPRFPWEVFRGRCDLDMPQVHWIGRHGEATRQLEASLRQFARLTPRLPYIPTGPAFFESNWRPAPDEIAEFLGRAIELGLPGANLWNWDQLGLTGAESFNSLHLDFTPHWQAAAGFTWREPSAMPFWLLPPEAAPAEAAEPEFDLAALLAEMEPADELPAHLLFPEQTAHDLETLPLQESLAAEPEFDLAALLAEMEPADELPAHLLFPEQAAHDLETLPLQDSMPPEVIQVEPLHELLEEEEPLPEWLEALDQQGVETILQAAFDFSAGASLPPEAPELAWPEELARPETPTTAAAPSPAEAAWEFELDPRLELLAEEEPLPEWLQELEQEPEPEPETEPLEQPTAFAFLTVEAAAPLGEAILPETAPQAAWEFELDPRLELLAEEEPLPEWLQELEQETRVPQPARPEPAAAEHRPPEETELLSPEERALLSIADLAERVPMPEWVHLPGEVAAGEAAVLPAETMAPEPEPQAPMAAALPEAPAEGVGVSDLEVGTSTPDWLSAAETGLARAETPPPAPEAAGESLPDWLAFPGDQALAAEAAPAPEAPAEGVGAVEVGLSPAAPTPDWLSAAETELARAETLPPAPEAAGESLPDWLAFPGDQALAAPAEAAPEPEAPGVELTPASEAPAAEGVGVLDLGVGIPVRPTPPPLPRQPRPVLDPDDVVGLFFAHLQDGQVEAALALYGPDFAHVTADRVERDAGAVRAFYEQLLRRLNGDQLLLLSQRGARGSISARWCVRRADGSALQGSDTFHLNREGRIVYHQTSLRMDRE